MADFSRILDAARTCGGRFEVYIYHMGFTQEDLEAAIKTLEGCLKTIRAGMKAYGSKVEPEPLPWRTDVQNMPVAFDEKGEAAEHVLAQVGNDYEVIFPMLVPTYTQEQYEEEDCYMSIPDQWIKHGKRYYYWYSNERHAYDGEYGSVGDGAIKLSEIKRWLRIEDAGRGGA